MAKYTCDIQVVAGKVAVTTTPPRPVDGFHKDDEITFKCAEPGAAIKYTRSSPFDAVAKGTLVKVGAAGKTFIVGTRGPAQNHYDCGQIVGGVFTPWGGGDKTPTNP